MPGFNLRIPDDDLYEKAKAAAKRDRRSLNSWILHLMERAVENHPASPQTPTAEETR